MRHNLSDVSTLIRDRRSFAPEAFSSRRVHRDVVEEILRAGTWAPTHGMTQPWRFTVFLGEAVDELKEALPEWYTTFVGDEVNEAKREKLKRRFETCNCVIGIGMVPDANQRISREDEEWAVASAVQNMHLMCTAYGLGAKWTTPGFMGLPEVRQAFGLPEEGKVMGLFYVGYPAGNWPHSHRWPLEFVTRWKGDQGGSRAHEIRPSV
ncbi:MAG: nitroreductase [Bacteroidetes bacterium]|nr:nitroreductase [Bacteroidota bacterium]MDA0903359.1 nitroreductase [Bacteroidota bacterium]MDA1242325.1 nitroreductase [Bacteroidota bacterium]